PGDGYEAGLRPVDLTEDQYGKQEDQREAITRHPWQHCPPDGQHVLLQQSLPFVPHPLGGDDRAGTVERLVISAKKVPETRLPVRAPFPALICQSRRSLRHPDPPSLCDMPVVLLA